MQRTALVWTLATAIAGAGCDEGGSLTPPPNNGVPAIDLSAFTGCWHLTGTPDTRRFGSKEVECRAALDSVLELLSVSGADSFFATIDSVTDLTFRAPYRGTGDFTGTRVDTKGAEVIASYHHAADSCGLATKIQGPLYPQESKFFAFYTVRIHFDGADSCVTGDCYALFTFEGVRRPEGRCP